MDLHSRYPLYDAAPDVSFHGWRIVDMSNLTDRVAIVTGASKGIGSGIAAALAAAGARVAVNYSSDRAGAERVAQAIIDGGGKAIAIGADVSKAAEVARLFQEVDSAFGRLDVLVNNAGVFRFGALAEITEVIRTAGGLVVAT
jgi:3-oxoacyl-[acyl-carrier protein] reductase